jgi:hypothetical protein
MRDREEDFQKLSERALTCIIANLDGLSVPGIATAHGPIICSRGGTARISGNHRPDAVQLSKHRFRAPETSTGEHNGFFGRRRRE